jgi:RNase adaptor protein for sRNA GlmZ degradation
MRSTRVVTFGHIHGGAPKTADRVFDVRDLDDPAPKSQIWDRARYIADRISEGDTVAIGCAQGKHRGPTVARALKTLFGGVEIEHRDMDKEYA